MDSINSLVKNKLFRATELYEEFKNHPLGFVDVGARGGVHPFILPIASLVNCLCFEPNEGDEKILYFNKPSDFSRLTVYNTAITDTASKAKFYITKNEVSSSLFKPDKEFIKRYKKDNFSIKEIKTIKTQSLDEIVEEYMASDYSNVGEFIKLDCQGAEYLILQGAERVLEGQCVILWCEVFFMQIYENQKFFSDVDGFLRKKGFRLYGLYPRYISAKKMDRKIFETEESIMEADAVYIKDPLDPITKNLRFSERSIKVLILGAMLLGYFDFACEVIQGFIKNNAEKARLINLAEYMSLCRKKEIERNVERLISDCLKDLERKYLYAKKFIDKNKGNNDIDFIQLD
jgi:FkbM family methyltransferase